MNTFSKYTAPIALLVAALGISTWMDNQMILFVGMLLALIWINRIAAKLQNVAVKNISLILIIGAAIWAIGVLMMASSI